MTVPLARRARTANNCRLCGTDISDRGWQAKYCTQCKDYRRYHYRTPLNEVPQMVLHTQCTYCSQPFNEPQWQPCCDRICAGKQVGAYKPTKVLTRDCRGCGEPFQTTNPKRRCCSKACTTWRHFNPGTLRVLDKECAYCLTPFRAPSPRHKYCSDACRQRLWNDRRKHNSKGSYVEDVSKKIVAERDRWRCQICRNQVDPQLAWPHPMSWSLDHIIPISKGGEHSYANTQLAHLTCNIGKRARTLEPTQLALIG